MENPVKIISHKLKGNSICISILEHLLGLEKTEWEFRLNNQFLLLGDFSQKFSRSEEEIEKNILHLESCGYLEKRGDKKNRLVITPDGKNHLKKYHRSKNIMSYIKRAASFLCDLRIIGKFIVFLFLVLLCFYGCCRDWLIAHIDHDPKVVLIENQKKVDDRKSPVRDILSRAEIPNSDSERRAPLTSATQLQASAE